MNNLFGLATSLGFTIAAVLVGGTVGGLFLDRKFNITPLFLLVGTLVGIGVALAVVVLKLRSIDKQS